MNERRAWVGLLVAAAALVAVAAWMVFRSRGDSGAPASAQTSTVAGGRCEPVELRLGTAAQTGPSAPVVLWAVGDVRMFVDGQPASGSPEKPLRLTAGTEHTLRIEAGKEPPLTTRFRLDADTPALLHAQVDDGLGITLVRLGLTCTSCEFPVSEVEIDHAPAKESSFALLRAAAAALRTDNWHSALERLRRVPPKSRDTASYLRLASSVYLAGGRPERAEKLARSVPEKRANDLVSLIDALDRLRRSEKERAASAPLERWNTLTERFGQLAARFQQAAPGQVAAAAKRLESLGAEFERAAAAKDVAGQLAAVAAAEQAVVQAAGEIRSTRPGDCQFQQAIVATLNP